MNAILYHRGPHPYMTFIDSLPKCTCSEPLCIPVSIVKPYNWVLYHTGIYERIHLRRQNPYLGNCICSVTLANIYVCINEKKDDATMC